MSTCPKSPSSGATGRAMAYFLRATLRRRGSPKTSRRQWQVRDGAAWEAASFSRLVFTADRSGPTSFGWFSECSKDYSFQEFFSHWIIQTRLHRVIVGRMKEQRFATQIFVFMWFSRVNAVRREDVNNFF